MLAKMLLLMMMSKTSHSFVAEDIAREQCFAFEDLKSVTLHGHADGIICLTESDNKMVLCNPATREFKKCASSDPGVGALGFRIDPKTRDFKVVNITENGEGDDDGDDEHLICNPLTIKLYTLSTESWREINTDTLETETIYILPGCLQMYYKGFCYWAGNEQLKEFISVFDMTENQTVRQLIISFDIVDEVFHPILFPDIIYDSGYSPHSQLLVWDESVDLYASIHDGSMGLWLMDDGGGWTKLFAFTALEDVPSPLRYWRGSSHDELLLMVSQEGCLFTFDLDTETQEYVPVRSTDDDQDSVFHEYVVVWGGDPDCLQVVCVGTIVPLNRSNQC